jgi:hypothetical protein
MFRYSASSSEARQALLPEELELIRAGGRQLSWKTNKVWKTTKAKIHAAEQSRGSTGPHRYQKGQVCSGSFAQLSQRPNSKELNDLKTATSAV